MHVLTDNLSIDSQQIQESANRQLLIASRQYATEVRWKSWWHLVVTLVLLGALMFIVANSTNILLSGACSLLIALTFVRLFILYHDYLHGTIFKDSLLAGHILKTYGHLMLTPPSVWKRAHDHHHHNNSRFFGASIGSFPVMTTIGYANASRAEKLEYRIARSPWIIVFGYFTVFLFGMCVYPLAQAFRRNLCVFWTISLHFGAMVLGWFYLGGEFTLFAYVIPTYLAMLMGSYLFYVQHNFPAAKVQNEADWTYSDAALSASSYLETGHVMRWFTGNIGFHHVHHLNSKIPFYRLPEAMAGLKGLQFPGRTSLSTRDILGCLRLKLWDPESRMFVTFAAVKANN